MQTIVVVVRVSCSFCVVSAPRSRQITTPTPHRSIFTGRMLFLTPSQQCQSTESMALTFELGPKYGRGKAACQTARSNVVSVKCFLTNTDSRRVVLCVHWTA